MMYLVKMINREELDQEFVRTGKVIQQRFHSWVEMAESYEVPPIFLYLILRERILNK